MKTITTVLLTFCVSLLMNAQDFEMVKDINPNGDSRPANMTEFNNKLFFQAREEPNGDFKLWVSEGSSDNTEILKNIKVNDLIATSDKLIIAGTENGDDKIWASDGTSGGTQEIYSGLTFTGSTSTGYMIGFFALNNKAFFAADDGTHGNELWVTDGTAGGTQMVKDINPNGDSTTYIYYNFGEYNGKLYFAADDGSNGEQLWVTDGTTAGTEMLSKLTLSGDSSPAGFTEYDGKLYFSARGGVTGRELYVTDGTKSGTHLVKDINPRASSSNPEGFTVFNGKLYFQADDGTNGRELWVTDGTESGTQILKDINPGSGDSTPEAFAELGGKLYFSANDGTNGKELWVTDGTTSGTHIVKDINPGSGGSSINYIGGFKPFALKKYGENLYFQANDGTNGQELWVTDGTEEGTKKIMPDLAPNSGPLTDANKYGYTIFNQSLYFGANYDNKGLELWKYTDKDMSVKEPEESKISLYPNPAVNELYLSAQIEVTEVSIVDLTGKTVYQGKPLAAKTNIDISHLPSALYLVKITTADSRSQTLKIIKK